MGSYTTPGEFQGSLGQGQALWSVQEGLNILIRPQVAIAGTTSSATQGQTIDTWSGAPPGGAFALPVWNLGPAGTVTIASAGFTMGFVTTAAPTYTNNTFAPISLDTSGNLRITGTLSTTPGPEQGSGQNQGVGNITIGATSAGIGVPALNSVGALFVASVLSSGVSATQAGSWSVSQAGAPWTISPISVGGFLTIKDATANNFAAVINANPTNQFGLVVRNIPSGTQTISGTITANQGTANATPWTAKITDGTNAVPIINAAPASAIFGLSTFATLYGFNSSNQYFPVSVEVTGVDQGLVVTGGVIDNTSTISNNPGIPIFPAVAEALPSSVIGANYVLHSVDLNRILRTRLYGPTPNSLNVPIGVASSGTSLLLTSVGALFVAPVVSAGVFASQAGTWNVNATITSTGSSITIHPDGAISPFNLAQVGGVAISLGQALGVSSIPVAVASDELVALGQAKMVNSLPVAIASDQSGVLVVQSSGNSSFPWFTTTVGPRADTALTNFTVGVTSSGIFISLASVGALLVAPVISAGVFAQQAGTWNVGTITALTSSVGVSATQAGTWNIGTLTALTSSVGVSASQAGTWNIGTLTAITSSVGVSATIVGQPIQTTFLNSVGTTNVVLVDDTGAFNPYYEEPNGPIPSHGVMIAGSQGGGFNSAGVTQDINTTPIPLQGSTASTGMEMGLSTRSREYFGNKATYSVAGSVSVGTASGSVTSLAYLSHRTTEAKRYQINNIRVSTASSVGAGVLRLDIASISSEGSSASGPSGGAGGTTFSPFSHDPADAASTAVFRVGAVGAPTRVTPSIRQSLFPLNFPDEFEYSFSNTFEGKPLVLLSGSSAGFEVRATVVGPNLTTLAGSFTSVACSFTWTEELATTQ